MGRWFVGDAAAELKYNWSPYRYAFNNPMRYIDHDGNFELENAQRYNRFSKYLQNEILGILTNARMMIGLQFYSTLGAGEIAKDFTWDKGPKIIVVEDLINSEGVSCAGHYDPNTPNLIYIDKSVVMALENASSEDIDAALLDLISTLLHEYTHYGDWTNDNVREKYETGWAFEEYAYGRRVGTLTDARKVIEEYKNRHDEQDSENKQRQNQKAWEAALDLPAGNYLWDGEKWVAINL